MVSGVVLLIGLGLIRKGRDDRSSESQEIANRGRIYIFLGLACFLEALANLAVALAAIQLQHPLSWWLW